MRANNAMVEFVYSTEGELKTDVFSSDVINLKKASKIYKIDNHNYKKNIYNTNKRIDCLAKVKSRNMNKIHIMNNNKNSNNICIQLLQNSLSFLRVKDKYA